MSPALSSRIKSDTSRVEKTVGLRIIMKHRSPLPRLPKQPASQPASQASPPAGQPSMRACSCKGCIGHRNTYISGDSAELPGPERPHASSDFACSVSEAGGRGCSAHGPWLSIDGNQVRNLHWSFARVADEVDMLCAHGHAWP
eukprot:366468-Chlamydomonas_euryale.AAC.4